MKERSGRRPHGVWVSGGSSQLEYLYHTHRHIDPALDRWKLIFGLSTLMIQHGSWARPIFAQPRLCFKYDGEVTQVDLSEVGCDLDWSVRIRLLLPRRLPREARNEVSYELCMSYLM